jgi:hypothetical protein
MAILIWGSICLLISNQLEGYLGRYLKLVNVKFLYNASNLIHEIMIKDLKSNLEIIL